MNNNYRPSLSFIRYKRTESWFVVSFLIAGIAAVIATAVWGYSHFGLTVAGGTVMTLASGAAIVMTVYMIRRLVYIGMCAEYLRKSGQVDWL